MGLRTYEPRYYPETAFGGIARCDGVVQFYSRINAVATPDSVIVDFGCGRGQHAGDPVAFRRRLRNFRGRVAQVIGLDVDAASATNPTIDTFRVIQPDVMWPVDNESADIVLCDCVLEHLARPQRFFAEAHRVLRSHGIVCIVTTNLLSYVGLAAKLTPSSLHAVVLARVQEYRQPEDIFPTVYRCNTIRAIRKELVDHGFEPAVYGFDAGPGYLTFSRVAYAVGYIHQQLAPSLIRPIIMAYGRKQR